MSFVLRPQRASPFDRLALFLWLACFAFALLVLGVGSVERTQEGRVLETAREMLGNGVDGWLIPHLNGELRLQKPPLAYWLCASSYTVFGISTWTGRFPFAITSWLTAGLTYLIGKRLFGARAGLFAMAAMFGCLMNARYGMLAETDVLTSLFVTLAIFANWRGILAERLADAAKWFHLGAVGTALAILSKGPPGAFPVLFLIAFALLARRPRAIGRWFLCLAPLTVFAIAVPWFAYVIHKVGYATFKDELTVVTEGKGHRGFFGTYFWYIVLDSIPWAGFLVVALWVGAKRCRRDPRLLGLVVWLLVILIPLCIAGQKQRHYLVPMVPPLMLVTGWWIDRALRIPQARHVVRAILIGTTTAIAVAAIGVLVGGWIAHRTVTPSDFVACIALGALARLIFVRLRSQTTENAMIALLLVAPIVPAIHNGWATTLPAVTPRSIAENVRRDYGPRTIRFVGIADLPLQFHVRTLPPITPDPNLSTIVLQTLNVRDAATPPPGTRLLKTYTDVEDLILVCDESPAATIAPTTAPTTQP